MVDILLHRRLLVCLLHEVFISRTWTSSHRNTTTKVVSHTLVIFRCIHLLNYSSKPIENIDNVIAVVGDDQYIWYNAT